jgi:hypothetical protein
LNVNLKKKDIIVMQVRYSTILSPLRHLLKVAPKMWEIGKKMATKMLRN